MEIKKENEISTSNNEESYYPRNYQDWKQCITVKCGIPLTLEFIDDRLISLNDKKSEYTRRFIKLYGEEYTNQIISWFALAKHEITNN